MSITPDQLTRWRGDYVAFGEETLWLRAPGTDRPEPLRLTNAQKTFVRTATKREGDGWAYALACASWSKRTGKSGACALIAVAECCLKPDRVAVVLSTTERQARSTLFRQACSMLRDSPTWAQLVNIQTTRILFSQTNSVIEVHPCEWSAIQGISADLALLDEWAVSSDPRVGEMLLSQCEGGLGLVSSQLGPTGGPVFALKQVADEGGDGRLFFDYQQDPIMRAPWLSEEWLASRKATLPEVSFAYMHENAPGTSANSLFTSDQLEACRADYALPQTAPEWAALRAEWGLGPGAAVKIGIGLDRALGGSGGKSETVLAAVGELPDGTYRLLALRRLLTSSRDEILGNVADIQAAVGRGAQRFETYQSKDVADETGAELVAATSQEQARMFGQLYRLVAERRFEYPAEGEGADLFHEQLAAFEIDLDVSGRLPKYGHGVGAKDDAVYAVGHAITAAQGVEVETVETVSFEQLVEEDPLLQRHMDWRERGGPFADPGAMGVGEDPFE